MGDVKSGGFVRSRMHREFLTPKRARAAAVSFASDRFDVVS
jgi:hypothetical protein